jgi:hypothetical protein
MVARTMNAEDVTVKLDRMIAARDALRDVRDTYDDLTREYPHGIFPDLAKLESEIEEYADYWQLDYDA